MTTTDQQAVWMNVKFGGRKRIIGRARFYDLKILSAKFCVRSRPWLKTANAVINFGGRAGKIHQAIFLFKNWSESGLRVVLRTRLNHLGLQAVQGIHDKIGADGGEAWSKSFGGVVGHDREFLLKKNVTSVEAGIDPHGGDAGDGLAIRDGPLDRRGATIFREQRGVEIDVAKRGEIEHPLRNDAAVTDDDDGVGLEGCKLSAEGVVIFDAVGL